ncbi:MAG: pilus assembly protein PilQ [Gammaproteobacteria bacterium]|nr:MAG: pilus assembly protein PilQ [Gammaproteobacteria bacterium]
MSIKTSLTKNKMNILPFALFAVFASQAADVSAISHGRSADGAYEVQIVGNDFSGVTSYSLNNPARVVVDIPNGKSQLAANLTKVNSPLVSSVVVVEGDDRVRATINMNKSVPYTLVDGTNKITVAVKDPVRGPLHRAKKHQTVARKADVDFTGGANGQGKVKVKLPNHSASVNVERVGNKVIARLSGGTFARAKKLNVSDFGTAVKSIDVYKNKLNINTSTDNYEIASYQNDKMFTIEFNKPTVAKLRQSELPPGDSRREYKGENLSLNFQDIEVRSVLQLIGDFTDTNIVVSGDVTGSITLRLNDVPWDQALDVILQTKGLGMQKNGNVIYIAPSTVIASNLENTYKISNVKEELAPLHEEIITVNYARAENLLEVLETEGRSNTKDGESGFLSSRGRITVDKRTNSLIINEVSSNIEKVRRLIAKLDVPVKHVLIDSRIVSASSDFAHELGIRWGGYAVGRDSIDGHKIYTGLSGDYTGLSSKNDGKTSVIKNRLGVNLPASNPTGSLAMRVLGTDFLLDMELSAMESNGRGEVISSPRVVAQDGNKAKIKSGKEIAYTTRDDKGTAKVRFKPVELSLEVTPKIAPNNMVDMILEVNKDTVGALTQTLDGVVPSINTNGVQTQVLVDNGETVVLGGVYEQTKTKSVAKVPGLGDLPYVGKIFRKDLNKVYKSELLIFVTPKIVDKRFLSNDKYSALRN